VELVLGRRDNPCTPEDAVAASMVADAAQASLQSGEQVRVALQPAG
jgi:myo-inositol 2-dehydrogenase/D-chiro-inositol 1-dehydrogenase